jgi:hypothetical protein
MHGSKIPDAEGDRQAPQTNAAYLPEAELQHLCAHVR